MSFKDLKVFQLLHDRSRLSLSKIPRLCLGCSLEIQHEQACALRQAGLKIPKCFFAVQDPRLNAPSKKTHPNFKVDPFMLHLFHCFAEMWDLGAQISFDEVAQGFKGRHYLKAKINHKEAGDECLIDCIGVDAFIFTFYQRANPAPKKLTDKGFSPTQARALFLFDQLLVKFCACHLDNLIQFALQC